MDVSAIDGVTQTFTEAQIMEQMVVLLTGASRSGWLGISLALLVSGVLGYLYVKIQKSRNYAAEETQKIRHTTQSKILTDNRRTSHEQLRAERDVYEFLKDDIDGHTKQSLGNHR